MDLQTARSLLSYDAETGLLTWLVHRGTRARAGAVAGGVNGDGYRHVCVNGRMLKAHRLAWLLHFGALPEHEIDHINGQRDDNRIANLRDVPHALNQLNQRRHRDKSTVTEKPENVTHCRDKHRDSLARARPPKGGMSRCHAVTETVRDVTTDRDSDSHSPIGRDRHGHGQDLMPCNSRCPFDACAGCAFSLSGGTR